MTCYAGIGARATPLEVLDDMRRLAGALADRNYTLRSGGALGADIAFETGARAAGGKVEVFLPWAGYNDNRTPAQAPPAAAYQIAERLHPAWHRLRRGGRTMMARNVQIILGPQLDTPVRFVICWTPGAQAGGGTGQAIRLANNHAIPVFDLADAATHARVLTMLDN
jgi:hypothetical protein